MPFELPFGVAVLNPVPVDYYSGPYTASNIQQAINIASASIPYGVRFQSMEVRLIIAGVSKKYWYRDNITDLVEFSSIGSGNSDIFYNVGGTVSATNSTSAIYRTGYIGIGTASPSTKLHIFATQSGAFRLVDGTQGPGYLLASDINGVATWTASTYAPDSNVVHKTGNENISGNKTFENIGFFSNVSVRNYNTGPSSTALDSITANGGIGIKSQNDGTGIGIYSNSTSTGLNYVGANSGVTTFSVNKTGAVSIGTGTASNSRFLVSSSGGTNSLVVNEQGDAIFRGDTKVTGVTMSALPPGSITFGDKTSIYSPGSRQIIIGTDTLSGYNYQYGWKFTDYQITNLWGNPIEVQNTIGTIGNLWVGSNYTFAGYGAGASQKSTLLVKGTTSSIMKVVGTGATWSNSASIFLIEDSGKVSIGPTYSSAFSNSRLDINVGSFLFGVHTNGDYVTSKGGGRYAFYDGSSGMYDATGGIIFKSYGTGDAFKFEPQYTTSNFSGVGLGNNIQRIILQEYPIAASFSNNQIRMIELSPTINKTGTASGIDRGLYIKPTLTSDINKFRSIEVTNGDVLFSTTGGNVGIGLTAPSTKLHIFATQSGAFRLEDGTQSYPGYVLTSDANGVGTWQGNPQITLSGATATALATWNNATIMCNFSATCLITIPDTGLPPNFSFRFIIISGNSSAAISFTYSSPVSILPNTLLTFAQYESGVIDRLGTSSNYYITY